MNDWLETSKDCFELPVTIRFGDTDPYGVVYFAAYFRFFHHGIEELFRHVGLPPEEYFRNQAEGFGLPVVGASCDFHRPVRYGEELRLAVSLLKVKEKAITFGFRFYRSGDGEMVARGRATIVAIDRLWRSCRLPAKLLKALEPLISQSEPA